MPTETDVYQRLLDHIEAANAKPGWGYRVSIPNKEFTPTTYPYLDIQYFPAELNGQFIGDTMTIAGVFMVTVIQLRNKGVIETMNIASKVRDEFPMGARLYGDAGLCVQINEQANIRPPLFEDSEMRIPITIPYISYI